MRQSGASMRRRARPAIGPKLRVLLLVVLALFSLLMVNSAYLGGVTLLEWLTDQTYQDYTYQLMFLFHLAVGLLLVVPTLVFIGLHLRNTWHRSNRAAVYAGLGLFAAVLVLLISGVILVRFDFFFIRNETVRQIGYWAHVIAPLVVIWLFVLHRLSGPPLRWRGGLALAGLGGLFALVLVFLQTQDPRDWGSDMTEPADFGPSFIQTASGGHLSAEVLMADAYCSTCHADVHAQWSNSAHRFASFNNPAYLFSVRNTREAVEAHRVGGGVDGAKFCAACHDLVPLLSGALDDPYFDDVNHPTAHAGITCTTCHAITHINSPRGNADFVIEEPIHYPFAFSENRFLQWVNAQLIKARPDFHNRTFLKPLHQDAEFCSTCHKIHLPVELNDYRWLRGQNHYDSFLLSGVSGHGVNSFYYPEHAQANCNGCHMPPVVSDDFGARVRNGSGQRTVSDHLFPAANTAVPYWMGLDPSVIRQHQEFLRGSLRLDVVALRANGEIDGALIGPLRPNLPVLEPGNEYLLQVVLRNLTVGHEFTQGTADSNEVWVEVEVHYNGELIGRSGGIDPSDGSVDPWAHRVNAYVIDRFGNRIDRRNPEDIFVALYNHQIPPGSADLIHYRLQVPDSLSSGVLEVSARLHYRKFDTHYLRMFSGPDFVVNPLPITTIAYDRVRLPVGLPLDGSVEFATPAEAWERMNDYGIGAFRKLQNRQLRQAEEIFAEVEAMGHSAGAINLVRVYLAEGRLDEAAAALNRAADHPEPPPPWTMAWLGGQLMFQEGRFEQALAVFEALADTRFPDARRRGFDFSRDYRLLNQLGLTWLEIARSRPAIEGEALAAAESWFLAALGEDPENAAAHYSLGQVYRLKGLRERAEYHLAEHARYRIDDNARDAAVAAARRNDPAADHAADPVVIYDLQRPGSQQYSLDTPTFKYRLSQQ